MTVKQDGDTVRRNGGVIGKIVPINRDGKTACMLDRGVVVVASDLREIADILDANRVVPSREDGLWECTHCQFKNKPTAQSCVQCQWWKNLEPAGNACRCKTDIHLTDEETTNLADSVEFMDGFEATCQTFGIHPSEHKIVSKIFQQRMEAMREESAEKTQRVLAVHAETVNHMKGLASDLRKTAWNVLQVRLLATISKDLRRVVDFLENRKVD